MAEPVAVEALPLAAESVEAVEVEVVAEVAVVVGGGKP
jgi:uridylate kinase